VIESQIAFATREGFVLCCKLRSVALKFDIAALRAAIRQITQCANIQSAMTKPINTRTTTSTSECIHDNRLARLPRARYSLVALLAGSDNERSEGKYNSSGLAHKLQQIVLIDTHSQS
jgi:hypothetical protein